MTTDSLIASLKWRYATKSFDPDKKIPADVWSALEESMVLTPSSFGLQPWKFFVITDNAIRESLVPHSWGQRQVADCSHLVVFTVPTTITEADVNRFIERIAEVRGVDLDSLNGYRDVIIGDVVHGSRSKAVVEWAKKQTYIALGQIMLAAAALGIDTCPMEGFEPAKYDEILGLAQMGLTTAVALPLGYRSSTDKYASVPKVRYPRESVIVHL